MLDGKLAQRRIYPAVNLEKTATRRDELLLDAASLEAITLLRRTASEMPCRHAISELIDKLGHIPTNHQLLQLIAATVS